MLVRFRQIENLGRFGGWDSGASCRDEARLARLSLIYGLNGSGKSTLVRLLDAAAAERSLVGERMLGAIGSPRVLLELAAGRQRYDADAWTGPRPRVTTFDRQFVDRNVFVGRRTTKDQRRHLLELALGDRDVALANSLDALHVRGRELAKQRREHDDALAAIARAHAISPQDFLALPPPVDADAERATAVAVHRAAVAAELLARLARPEPLATMPAVDLDAIAALLATESTVIAKAVAAQVEAHLAGRLHGAGSAWVRAGLDHADGATCPFCAQPVDHAPLIEMYRQWFDRAYDELVAKLDRARAQLGELAAWWREVQRVGGANRRAFESWEPYAELVRPPFDSPTRKRQLDELTSALAAILDAKRRDASRPADASGLAALRALRDELVAAVATYNGAIAEAGTRITARLREASGVSASEAQRRLARIDAAVARHAPLTLEHVARRAELDAAYEELRLAKERDVQRLRDDGVHQLAEFAARINAMLATLGADFTIGELAAERSGGSAAARLTLYCERGELEVASARDEERLQQVLSDGDRSTLALAVFLLSLPADLSDRIVVLDDPTTSQDDPRSDHAAAQIAALATRAAQVIVLSHDAAFCDRVAAHAQTDTARLELDKARRTLVPYKPATPQPILAKGSAPTPVPLPGPTASR